MAAYKITKTGKGIIPQGETTIKKNAFKGNKKLTSIVIPEGITTIEEAAFSGCCNLISVTLPDSLESIEFEAFSGCVGLTSFTIPVNVTYIDQWIIKDCVNLSCIIVAEGNRRYDSRNNCNAIIETESNSLLYGCANTIIPDSVTEIRNFAFIRCKNLRSILVPDSVTAIRSSAFSGCSNLVSIKMPEGVDIEKDAFLGCPCMISKEEENPTSAQNEKVAVIFTYEGELIYSIQGECCIEMTTEELRVFKLLTQQGQEEDGDDILAYLKENMPQTLYDVINREIALTIRCNVAKETIECEGCECFKNMGQAIYDSMTIDELIDRYLDENMDAIYDYIINSITVKE